MHARCPQICFRWSARRKGTIIEHMIEQRPHRFGVSLAESVLARWLVELSGRQYVLDDFQPHRRHGRSGSTAADLEPASASAVSAVSAASPADAADAAGAGTPAAAPSAAAAGSTDAAGASSDDGAAASTDETDPWVEEVVDDRFPGLGRFRGGCWRPGPGIWPPRTPR